MRILKLTKIQRFCPYTGKYESEKTCTLTAQKLKFFIKDYLMKNFIFCAVFWHLLRSNFFVYCFLKYELSLRQPIEIGNLFFDCLLIAQKVKFSIMDFFSKCDQIHRKLRIWSHLLKKSLMEKQMISLLRLRSGVTQSLGQCVLSPCCWLFFFP